MPTRRNRYIADGFLRYAERAFTKKFDGVGLLRESNDTFRELQSVPRTIIYGTHSSWWDVMIAALLSHRTGLQMFAPMDAAQLRKYWILEYVGLFPASPEKALSYVRTLKELFAREQRSALFITPQAEFICNRVRQPEFKRGLVTAIDIAPEVPVYAVSVQYEFWSESRPLALLSITRVNTSDRDNLNESLRQHLDTQTNRLLSAASRRNDDDWTWLIRPKARTLLIQDATNTVRSLATGKKFESGHSR